MKMQKGFTLIELMIVIAILGILIAIALPAYQDYTIRTKVSEGLNLAAAAKIAVGEYRLSNQAWPTSNAQAGYDTVDTAIVDDIIITTATNGIITITYKNPPIPSGGTIRLEATVAATGGVVQWSCNSAAAIVAPHFGTSGTLLAKYAPGSCR